MRNAAILMIVLGLLMFVYGAAQADQLWQIQVVREDGSKEPWVSPKGYTAMPQSLTACLIDLSSARVVDKNTLSCERLK